MLADNDSCNTVLVAVVVVVVVAVVVVGGDALTESGKYFLVFPIFSLGVK